MLEHGSIEVLDPMVPQRWTLAPAAKMYIVNPDGKKNDITTFEHRLYERDRRGGRDLAGELAISA